MTSMTPMTPMTSASRPLPRSRTRAVGAPGTGALTWVNRVAGVALIGAAAFVGYMLLRPLPSVPDVMAQDPLVLPPVVNIDVPTTARRDRIAALTRQNPFHASRDAWAIREPAPLNPDGSPASGAPGAGGTGALAGNTSTPANIDGRSINVTDNASLPDDVKTALTGLMLRAVFEQAKDQPRALISRVHAGPNPFAADVFAPGDEFEDKQHPQAKWRVEGIDVPGRRVILSRSGVNAALELYPAYARPDRAAAAAAAPAAPVVPVVVARSENEARADLISGGLTEAEADRLLELARLGPDQATVQAALDALAAGAAADAKAGDKAARSAPPPGMEAVLEMMKKAATPSPDERPGPRRSREDRERPRERQ
jgi:hypothetical protein